MKLYYVFLNCFIFRLSQLFQEFKLEHNFHLRSSFLKMADSTLVLRMEEDDYDGKGAQETEDSSHADSGLLSMLAEEASATLHNDSLARKSRNPRGRPRKQTNEGRPDPEPDTEDANKLSLAQLQLLTEKQLVDLFSTQDSDEIRRNFSYSCHLLQRCNYTSTSFGSEMKARQVCNFSYFF